MNTFLRTTLLAAALMSLVACQGRTPTAAPASGAGGDIESDVGNSVSRGMQEAQRKLETENITVRSDNGGLHKAEITPAGGLLIDGKSIPLDNTQRLAVLEYRARTIEIAHAGMDIGVQGAKLATKAVSEAIGGLFSGHPDQIDKRMEAQTRGMKQAASALCDKLPALRAAQAKVGAAVPEFAPFATMDDHDINDCKHDLEDKAPPPPPSPPAPPAPPVTPATR